MNILRSNGSRYHLTSVYTPILRMPFRRFSTESTSSNPPTVDLHPLLNELKSSMQKMQEEIEQLKNTSPKNISNLQKIESQVLDVKKTADVAKILAFLGATFTTVVAGTYWITSQLNDKPSKAELKEELGKVENRIIETEKRIIETEKRIIETITKDFRLALTEAENRRLKEQQHSLNRKN